MDPRCRREHCLAELTMSPYVPCMLMRLWFVCACVAGTCVAGTCVAGSTLSATAHKFVPPMADPAFQQKSKAAKRNAVYTWALYVIMS